MKLAIVVTAVLFAPTLCRAQDPAQAPVQEPAAEPKAPPVPFAVINISSVDRLFKDTEFMFRSINRPDVYEFFLSLVAGRANDLKGIDRSKPMGVMLFLEPGFPPKPCP